MTSYKNNHRSVSPALNPINVSYISGNEDSFLCKTSGLNHSINLPMFNLEDLNESRFDIQAYKDAESHSNKIQMDKESFLQLQLDNDSSYPRNNRHPHNRNSELIMPTITETFSKLKLMQIQSQTVIIAPQTKEGRHTNFPSSNSSAEENKNGVGLSSANLSYSYKNNPAIVSANGLDGSCNEEAKKEDISQDSGLRIENLDYPIKSTYSDSKEKKKLKDEDSTQLKNLSEKMTIKPQSPAGPSIDEKTCKICLETTEDETSGPFIHPCKCTGSVSYIHEGCLKTWIQSKGIKFEDAHCELCKTKYKMKLSCKLKFYPKGALNKGVASLISSVCLLGMIIGLFILIISVVTSKDLNSTTPSSQTTNDPNNSNQYVNQTLLQQEAIQAQKNRSAKLVIGLLCTVFIVILSLLFCYTFKEAFFISNIEQWKIENYGNSDSKKKQKSQKKNESSKARQSHVEQISNQNERPEAFSVEVSPTLKVQTDSYQFASSIKRSHSKRIHHILASKQSDYQESSAMSNSELSIRTDLYYCDGGRLFYENFDQGKRHYSVPNKYSDLEFSEFKDEILNLSMKPKTGRQADKIGLRTVLHEDCVGELSQSKISKNEFGHEVEFSSGKLNTNGYEKKMVQINKIAEDDLNRNTTIRGS